MATKSVVRKELSMERRSSQNEASNIEGELKVPVIYYLSRNGHLEHPHLMEVSISSSLGKLCLKDVIDRLSFLQGHGMANMYSWSTKRSYKRGLGWQDLSENSSGVHDEYIPLLPSRARVIITRQAYAGSLPGKQRMLRLRPRGGGEGLTTKDGKGTRV